MRTTDVERGYNEKIPSCHPGQQQLSRNRKHYVGKHIQVSSVFCLDL